MKRNQAQAVSLGELQNELNAATKQLKSTQSAKLKADRAYEQALEAHERARMSLNAGVAAVKTSATVANLYAS